MPVCIVKGCSNRSSLKNRKQEELEKTMKITLHVFPKCPMKRQLWLNSLGLQNSVVPKYAAVCSVHFRHEDLDRTSLVCVRLKENAIPYVKLPQIKMEENFNACKEISTEDTSTSVQLPEIKIENFNTCEDISTEEPSTSMSSAVIKVETGDLVAFTEPMSMTGGKTRHLGNTGSHEVGPLLQSSKSTEAKVSLVDNCTSMSPSRLFYSPGKQILQEHISKIKRKHQLELKALKNKIKRRDRKITDLQTILQTLKKKNS